jgi:hypothetical protein
MENEKLQFKRLPNGEKVVVETVDDSTWALVERIEGERRRTLARCLVSNLQSENSEKPENLFLTS